MTMTKPRKKLTVNRQTIRVLDGQNLEGVAGGLLRPLITSHCPQPSANCQKLEN
jgi:hypothetical protein